MKLQITIENRRYEAEVEILPDEGPLAYVPATELIPGAGAAPAPARPPAPVAGGGPEDTLVRAAVMGIVMKVDVSPGQRVESGQELLTLEAMKMESAVKAARAGVVAQVHVAPGDSVKKGQVLVELATE